MPEDKAHHCADQSTTELPCGPDAFITLLVQETEKASDIFVKQIFQNNSRVSLWEERERKGREGPRDPLYSTPESNSKTNTGCVCVSVIFGNLIPKNQKVCACVCNSTGPYDRFLDWVFREGVDSARGVAAIVVCCCNSLCHSSCDAIACNGRRTITFFLLFSSAIVCLQ